MELTPVATSTTVVHSDKFTINFHPLPSLQYPTAEVMMMTLGLLIISLYYWRRRRVYPIPIVIITTPAPTHC
jgi:hypothetical protein